MKTENSAVACAALTVAGFVSREAVPFPRNKLTSKTGAKRLRLRQSRPPGELRKFSSLTG